MKKRFDIHQVALIVVGLMSIYCMTYDFFLPKDNEIFRFVYRLFAISPLWVLFISRFYTLYRKK